MTRLSLLALPLLFALAGCEQVHNLNERGCLPLTVPTQVTLQQEAGLFTVGAEEGLFLMGLPRDTTNDAFHNTVLVRTLPPGTVLTIDRLTQEQGFDSGMGRISAWGATPAGERFEHGWGAGQQIGRAPWEPASVGNLRTVDCGAP